jgi:tetratricopeptide (TPR) repeat protein
LTWFWGATLVLLVTVVYWPTLHNGFISDDFVTLQNNPSLRSASGLRNIWCNFEITGTVQYYPIVFSTFWAEYHLWGLDPRGYHIVNFLLHATAAVLAWRLLVRLEVPGAWLAAAIFAVHPVEVESVAWASERKNMLSCVLALGSLLAYLRFSSPETPSPQDAPRSASGNGWQYYAWALGLYVAALLSKTVTASVPAVLLVIYWWKRGRITRRDVANLAPFFVVGLALSYVTVWVEKTYVGAEGEAWDLTLLERVLVAGRALWFYVGKLAWPHPLIFFYPRWEIDTQQGWQYLFPLAAVGVLVGLWLARARIGRGPLAAVLIFAGVLTPALGFFNVYFFRFSQVADHFQYHASIAMAALAAAALTLGVRHFLAPSQWFAPAAAAAVILPLALLAHQKTYVYKDQLTVDEEVAAWDPQSWVAHHNIGEVLRYRGRYEEAIFHSNKAVEIREDQVRDNPARRDYLCDLAEAYAEVAMLQEAFKRPADALVLYCRALEVRENLVQDNPLVSSYQSDLAASHVNVGSIERAMGHLAEAERSFRKAIEIREKLAQDNPTIARYQNNFAATLVDLSLLERVLGRPAKSEESLQKALEIRAKLVEDNPSIEEYQNSFAGTYVELGLLEQAMGQGAKAESAFRKAIEIREPLVRENPTVSDYQDGLAWSYLHCAVAQQQNGRPAEAEASYRQAIAVREKLAADHPTNGDYQNDTATSYVDLGILQRDMGRPADAIVACQKAIAIREPLVRQHPTVTNYQAALGWSYANLVVALLASGQPTAAVAACQKAVTIREQLVRENPKLTDYRVALGWGYANLGAAQSASGQPTEAEASHRKAIEIRGKLIQDNPKADDYKHEIALSCRDLGNVQLATGRLAEAVASYQTAVEIHQQLAAAYPTNSACQANWASDLVQCGDALALLGRWSESAELYAQAVPASNYAWPTLWPAALVQLAAGNDAGYRHLCHELVTRYGDRASPDDLFSLALTLAAGDIGLDDRNQVLAIAERAAAANPSDSVAAILVGAAQYRAGQRKEAITTLVKALPKLDPAAAPATAPATDKPDRVLVGQLLGESTLAVAYYEQTGRKMPKKRRDALQDLIDKPAMSSTHKTAALPPWAVGSALEIAKQELIKLNLPFDVKK